jgi:four helix bundle protein
MVQPQNLRVFVDAQAFADCLIPLISVSKLPLFFQHQLLKSCTSVPANLAEFCALGKPGSKIEKLARCMAENNEVSYWLHIWKAHYELQEEQYARFMIQHESVGKQLAGLSRHILNEEYIKKAVPGFTR